MKHLQRTFCFLKNLLGIWCISDDMSPSKIVDKAIKRWGNPSAALRHLLRSQSPATNELYASCILWGRIESKDPLSNLHILRTLLERLPVQQRAEALAFTTNSDPSYAAYILTRFLPVAPDGLDPVAKYILALWSAEPRCDDLALNFYQSLTAYGAPIEEMQWVIATALVARGLYSQAEPLLINLARIQPSPDVWWHLAHVFQVLRRPPQYLLNALYHFIESAPWDARASQALQEMGDLYGKRQLDVRDAVETSPYLKVLRGLLEVYPEQKRPEILALVTKGDDSFIATILSSLTPPVPAGLTPVAHAIMNRWVDQSRNDDLALQLYYSLPGYGIPPEVAYVHLARSLIARRLYIQAEELLHRLAQQHRSPDVLWLLANVYQSLNRSLHLQLETLQHFISSAPSDPRVSKAWKMIGDLYGERLGDGMEAVKAFERAEELTPDVEIPQLSAFRVGEWDAIPALRTHPDYAFPVTVAVDLEVDPESHAKHGARVFEVAAVRMRGNTILREYQSFIRRPFRPAKMQSSDVLEHAPEQTQVADELRKFLGEALVVGHNLRDFDARELEGMEVLIPNDQIIDTLIFARLLYPDSPRHNLTLLCSILGVENEGEWHTALADARVCGQLLYALGNELTKRGDAFLNGFRALVRPESKFNKVVLEPRGLSANAKLPWSLDPRPTVSRITTSLQGLPASPCMQNALQGVGDMLVELDDPEAAYFKYLPADRRVLVTTSSRARIENMLAAHGQREGVYVIADPRTLLCPQRLYSLIESSAADSEYQLLLFCIYQASHNHDTSTLYPMRLDPGNDPSLLRLRNDLMRACCSTDMSHSADCQSKQAHLAAIESHRILLATQEALVHQEQAPGADIIIIDDAAELQMHLAEYRARSLRSDVIDLVNLDASEQEAQAHLWQQITACARAYVPQPGFHERLPLQSVARYLMQPDFDQTESVYAHLNRSGNNGRRLAEIIKYFCEEAKKDPILQNEQKVLPQNEIPSNRVVHAHWIDLWFRGDTDKVEIERWAICGLSEDLGKTFLQKFWQPYSKRILCGTALTVRENNTTFLERYFNLPKGLPVLKDERPQTQIYVPSVDTLPPSGFLCRMSWTIQVGALLYSLQEDMQDGSLLVTLNHKAITEALAEAFKLMKPALKRQVLATQFGWTTTKIRERLTQPERSVLALVSPRVRLTHLDVPVDVEVTGPLRFLNTQDPLVAAHMRIFEDLYEDEGPFIAYLLPQALLELKTRLSTRANLHIVLDSRLHSRVYRDETFAMLNEMASIREVPWQSENSNEGQATLKTFLSLLSQQLEHHGFSAQEDISDDELHLVLRKFWDTEDFKLFPVEDTSKPVVTQKEIVRALLHGKDQLLIAATGGGKSLCFQLPALLLTDQEPPKVTLIFTPLISLMSDQVEALRMKGIFSAITLNSSLSTIQRQEHLRGLKRGEYSIVYIAPEQIRSSGLRRALEEREIGLIAVDEAHCLSQWGHDFRTDYFAVKDWIERLSGMTGRQFPILALTATARKGYIDLEEYERSDQTSTLHDIIEKLKLNIREEEAVIASPQRNELEFHVEHIVPPPQKCKCGEVLELKIGQVKCPICHTIHRIDEQVEQVVEQMKLHRLIQLFSEPGQTGLRSRWDRQLGERQRGIVYCAYIKTTEQVAERLRKSVPGLRVKCYHSELEPEEKDEVLRRFKSDQQDGLDVIVATNAFGMGIDIRRLGFVIHFDVPGTPEAYYQEAGRAGRDQFFRMDQERAICILLYHPTDLNKQRYLSRKNRITRYQIEDVYDVLCELRRDMENSENSPGEHPTAEMKHEVIFTAQDIATRAGVSEEQIGMILYYLEYHTQLHGNPILRRGETAHSILQIKFERGYEEQMQLLPESSPSRPLLDCFLHSDIFGLNEDAMTTTTLSLKELAEYLSWSIPKVERELLNLVQRHIVTYICQGRITWTSDPAHARQVLTDLAKNIETLLTGLDKKKSGVLFRGETVFEDLVEVCAKHKLNAVPLTYLLHFLSALSHKEANELRLFKRFARVVRRSHAGRFEMRLYTEHNCIPLERLGRIFDELLKTLSLVEQHVKDTQQEFDLLKLRPHYASRQRLHRQLLLLDVLGLLKYTSDPSIGLAMRVIFQQPYAPRDQIEIDLKSLRLKETYDKHKLKLMERYATETQQETRAESFNSYFFGRNPLVEHIDQAIRADLTAQQQDLTKLAGGIHLIEGPAGCGKTTVLVEYIKHLVYQGQVPIERIMVTTHYKSATNRIAKALEVLQEDGSLALATTMNSFGEMIFKKYRLLLLRSDGLPYYEKEPHLLSGNLPEIQQKELSLVNKALTSIYAGTWQKDPWPADLDLPSVTGAYQPNDELERQCLDAVKRLREQGVFPLSSTSVNKEQMKAILGRAKDTQCPLSLRYAVYHAFLQLKGRENTYTFDDQVLFALAILRNNPAITKEYSHFFEYIVVDELQDFTSAQANLFLQLSTVQHNVMCFGDRDQEIRMKETGVTSIFEWFARMDSCGKGNAHQLTTNFRSTQRILDLVSFVRDYQESRKRPPLKSAFEDNGELPVLLRIGTDDEQLFSNHRPVGIQAGTTPIKVMVKAALELIQQIPEPERGSTALIAMKSNWHFVVANYLTSRGENFSILNNRPLYQQHHVNRILVYLRLIVNPRHDRDMEQLLRFCLVPYFEDQQVKILKELARQAKVPLIRVLKLEKALRRANITREQESALQQHLAVIARFQSDSLVSQVEEALWAIDNGPFAMLVEEEQKLDDVKEVLRHLRHKTISEAVAEIKQHLSFLEEEQKHTGLIVTTIDHAKSEEFDTVFLLGADYLGDYPNPGNTIKYKRRLYVGISRARKRLFLVGHGEHQMSNPLLLSIPEYLYKEMKWSPMVYQMQKTLY